MRAIVLAFVAIQIGMLHPAHAEDIGDSGRAIIDLLPLFIKNHCEDVKGPAEQIFCGDAELNNAAKKLAEATAERLNRIPNRRLAIAENAEWIRDRNSSCGILGKQNVSAHDLKAVRDCLLKETEERIEILTDPNFDCLATSTTAGLLICGDPALATAKAELNGLVLGLIAKLKENEAQDAFAEFERWGRERDRKCGVADKDNVPLHELSSSESCLADYFTKKIAEIVAAKGDPKRVFGLHQFSAVPNADAVDLCVAQIHSANACESFLSVDRVFPIDVEVTEQNATVIAEVEMVVLSPFAVCSPIATNCTGTCWDPKSGKPRSALESRDSFAVAHRLKIEKSFAFQKTDKGRWRCNPAALSPVEIGFATSGP